MSRLKFLTSLRLLIWRGRSQSRPIRLKSGEELGDMRSAGELGDMRSGEELGDMRPREELGDKLYESEVKSAINGRPFIPLDKLDALLVEDAIKSELSAAGVRGSSSAPLLEYISKHARKIFAILVMIEETRIIEDMAVSGLRDADLPLGVDRDEKLGGIVRSYNHASDSLNLETKWLVFQKLRRRPVTMFCEFQWRLLAPKIVQNEFDRFIHVESPLPFLPPASGIQGKVIFSHHSKVHKAEIHEAHIQCVSMMILCPIRAKD